MKFTLRTLLLAVAIAAVLITGFQVWQFESRKTFTQPALDITNGTDGDRAMRKFSAESVAKLSIFRSAATELVAFRIHPGRGRYILSAYWVGNERHADGLEIAYSDGSKIETLFHKDKSGQGDDWLFFSAMVFSERLPAPYNANQPKNVSTVTLTKAGVKCSNTVLVTTPRDETTIWTDAVGACIEDDLELWGFNDSHTADAGSG